MHRRDGLRLEVALLTGGWDRPYTFGLTTALAKKGIKVDLIAGGDLSAADFPGATTLTVLNLKGTQKHGSGLAAKIVRAASYYGRLVRYAWSARPKIFHILWNNGFDTFDRVAMMLYYRMLGKRVVLTAHNVNAGRRDAKDTLLNRLTLKVQYALSDHIFVHTEKMKQELVADFWTRPQAVTVIPFGINNSVPDTALTPAQARARLGIAPGEKTLLFFGNIAPYKGLEYLVAAFRQVAVDGSDYRLIVAGRPKSGSSPYWEDVRAAIGDNPAGARMLLKTEYIPDEDTEVYFKAADVLALPYTAIFQSGVLFLAYSFGLPVLAADVGSLREDVVEGRTGFVFKPNDSVDLARAIETYFGSDLFADLHNRRDEIRKYANARHSWESIAELTRNVYCHTLQTSSRDVTVDSVGSSSSVQTDER